MSRCSRTGQWRKARWWQRSSLVKDAFGIRFAFRQSASLILRLSLLVFSLEEVRATGIEINTGYFPFRANGRAMTLADDQASFVSWPGPTITYCSAFREWVLALRSCRQPSAWRSKCVRGSRTLLRQSMPTRPRAKASWRPLSRLWVIRSTCRPASMALDTFSVRLGLSR